MNGKSVTMLLAQVSLFSLSFSPSVTGDLLLSCL